MPLIRKPRRPQWTPFSTEMFSLKRYREWMPFLTHGRYRLLEYRTAARLK